MPHTFCPKCGAKVEWASSCSQCGARILLYNASDGEKKITESPQHPRYVEAAQGIWWRRLNLARLFLGLVVCIGILVGLIVGIVLFLKSSQSTPEPIPFSASSLLASPPSTNYAPSSLDQEFFQLYGHTYYRSIQLEQPEIEIQETIENLEDLLRSVEKQVQFTEKYEANYFDCSEMSAFMEYYLERNGYRASIFMNHSLSHDWVMVYSTGGWIPIETTNLFIPTPTNCEDYSMYSEPEERYDSIGAYWESFDSNMDESGLTQLLMSEVDWWETRYADELEEVAGGGYETIDIYADQDNDGLTTQEEKQWRTDPLDPDSDSDGLNDGDEIKSATNPLNHDTDNDGVIDGNDLFPLRDARIEIDITYFEEKVAADPSISAPGDPYFIISVDGVKQESQRPCFSATYKYDPYSTVVNISDNQRYVDVSIEVWDYDGVWSSDEQYDASSKPDSLVYTKSYDVLSGNFVETSDGTLDGSLQGPQCQIKIKIRMV